jgi:hypothetical protein
LVLANKASMQAIECITSTITSAQQVKNAMIQYSGNKHGWGKVGNYQRHPGLTLSVSPNQING